MKRFLLTLLLLGASSLPSWASPCNLSDHSQLIVAQQLNRTLPGLNELAQWKRWESLLLECREAVDVADPGTLKNFLFLGYVARETNAAASKEYMIGELYPIYKENPAGFWKVLKQNPLFTEASCYYRGRYFGFEDRKTISKAEFLKENAGAIYNSLPLGQAQTCLNALAAGH